MLLSNYFKWLTTFTMLLNSLGRRRIWGLENYIIKAYRAAILMNNHVAGQGCSCMLEGTRGRRCVRHERRVLPGPAPAPATLLRPHSCLGLASLSRCPYAEGRFGLNGRAGEGEGRGWGQWGQQKGACRLLARGGVGEGKMQDERPCRQPVPPRPRSGTR